MNWKLWVLSMSPENGVTGDEKHALRNEKPIDKRNDIL